MMDQPCCTTDVQSASGMPAEDEHSGILDIRIDKVLEIRRQLDEGTYSVADRLDIVVEKILRDFE